MRPKNLQRKKLVPLISANALGSRCRGAQDENEQWHEPKWLILGSIDWRAVNSEHIFSGSCLYRTC